MRGALSFARQQQSKVLADCVGDEIEIQRWIYKATDDNGWSRFVFDGCYRLMPDGRLTNFNRLARSYSRGFGLIKASWKWRCDSKHGLN
jgi:hypothetical protein